MSLEIKLKEIEDRANAATEGPWTSIYGDYVGFVGQQFFNVIGGKPDEDGDFEAITSNRVKLENALFIAHARQDIPKLLAVIKLLIEQRDYVADYPVEGIQDIERMNNELAKILGDEK